MNPIDPGFGAHAFSVAAGRVAPVTDHGVTPQGTGYLDQHGIARNVALATTGHGISRRTCAPQPFQRPVRRDGMARRIMRARRRLAWHPCGVCASKEEVSHRGARCARRTIEKARPRCGWMDSARMGTAAPRRARQLHVRYGAARRRSRADAQTSPTIGGRSACKFASSKALMSSTARGALSGLSFSRPRRLLHRRHLPLRPRRRGRDPQTGQRLNISRGRPKLR